MKFRNGRPRHLVGLGGAEFRLHDPIENVPIESGSARLALRLDVFGHKTIGQFGNSWSTALIGFFARRIAAMGHRSKNALRPQFRFLWRDFSDCPYCVAPIRRAAS
jgi:hypothetical protein